MAFANIGSTEGTFNAVSSSADTTSAAVPALGANRIGVVLAIFPNGTTQDVTSITWNGVSMTSAVNAVGNSRRVAIYYLAECAQNGTYDIVVNFGAAWVHSVHMVVAWADATGAITLDDTSSDTGASSASTSLSITSTQATANEWVISGSANAANDLAAPSVTDCTLLQDWDQGGNCTVAAYSTPASSGDVTHQHNYSQSAQAYTIASASFQEASTGRTVLNTRSNPLGVNVGMGWRMPA